jgi:hypothetical protein
MKHIMKMTLLLGCIVVSLGIGIANAEDMKAGLNGKMSADSGKLWDSVVKETRLTGTLSKGASWLVPDQPIYFAKGSKSERVVSKVRLNVPADLQGKIPAMENRHVVADGPMECTMEFSPWTASCELTIKHVEVIK